MYRGAKVHLAINHSEATVPVLLHGIISLLNSDKDNRNITVKVSKSTTFSDDEFKLDLDNFYSRTNIIFFTVYTVFENESKSLIFT